jgi:hypothetical protein
MDAPRAGKKIACWMMVNAAESPDASLLNDSCAEVQYPSRHYQLLREADVITPCWTTARTLEEIGEQFSLTRERVQIKEKGHSSLKTHYASQGP